MASEPSGKAEGERMPAARPTPRQGAAGTLLWLMVGALSMGFFALPTLLLLVAGMVPTVVAVIVDRRGDRLAPLAVGSLNFAGLFPSFLALWTQGHGLGGVTRVMADPYTWLMAFGAAAIGWALVLGLPWIVETVLAFRNEAEIRRLRNRQAALVAEWGPEVAGRQPPE